MSVFLSSLPPSSTFRRPVTVACQLNKHLSGWAPRSNPGDMCRKVLSAALKATWTLRVLWGCPAGRPPRGGTLQARPDGALGARLPAPRPQVAAFQPRGPATPARLRLCPSAAPQLLGPHVSLPPVAPCGGRPPLGGTALAEGRPCRRRPAQQPGGRPTPRRLPPAPPGRGVGGRVQEPEGVPGKEASCTPRSPDRLRPVLPSLWPRGCGRGCGCGCGSANGPLSLRIQPGKALQTRAQLWGSHHRGCCVWSR